MIDIRPIVAAEADAFLALLCSSFEIDFDRVRGVFFQEPMFDLNRKWALFENEALVSVLTTVPLEFGWGRAFGIAGVGTRTDLRGQGYGERLLRAVLDHGVRAGEPVAYLFAKDPRLYARAGFEVLDDVMSGPIHWSARESLPELLSTNEVRLRYDAYASRDANVLRRDDKRWRYWQWNLRMSYASGMDGYLCQEGTMVREAVSVANRSAWQTTEPCHWTGLRNVTEALQIPLAESSVLTHFMGWGASQPPKMFMTDQF